MCIYPRLLPNPKYKSNKKNKGIIPQVKDKRALLVPVACGNCEQCRKRKRREWKIRLSEECENDKKGIFVTLTFSNESIKELGEKIELDGYERDNAIATLGVRRFLERWRKKHKKSVKHFLITELGHQGTENIHIHGIIWTDKREDIESIWRYGFVWLGAKNRKVGDKAVNYIIKYITKLDIKHREYKPKILCSQGLGKKYIDKDEASLNKFKGKETRETYITKQGYKLALPLYYRNKIYSEDEREKLWMNKLDSNIRYINGIKINMNEKGSNKRLERVIIQAQKENKQKGYGDNTINWDRRIYERQIRNLQYWKRINNKNKCRSAGSSPDRQVFRE